MLQKKAPIALKRLDAKTKAPVARDGKAA